MSNEDDHYLDGVLLPARTLYALALLGYIETNGDQTWRWTPGGAAWLNKVALPLDKERATA